jgi:hypothetical protein
MFRFWIYDLRFSKIRACQSPVPASVNQGKKAVTLRLVKRAGQITSAVNDPGNINAIGCGRVKIKWFPTGKERSPSPSSGRGRPRFNVAVAKCHVGFAVTAWQRKNHFTTTVKSAEA